MHIRHKNYDAHIICLYRLFINFVVMSSVATPMAVQQQHSSAAVNSGGQKAERKALLLKERGNKHFSNKELTQALQCYSQVCIATSIHK